MSEDVADEGLGDVAPDGESEDGFRGDVEEKLFLAGGPGRCGRVNSCHVDFSWRGGRGEIVAVFCLGGFEWLSKIDFLSWLKYLSPCVGNTMVGVVVANLQRTEV